MDGKFVSWFATKFDEVDEKAIGIQFGDSASQQVAEALAVLIGVRAWLSIWPKGLPILEVKSDSVAALTMVARACTRSPQVAVVARELALTFSESCVRPQVVKHTPGVANKLADILSWRFQPGVQFVVPQAPVRVPEVPIWPRTMDFYRSVRSALQTRLEGSVARGSEVRGRVRLVCCQAAWSCLRSWALVAGA